MEGGDLVEQSVRKTISSFERLISESIRQDFDHGKVVDRLFEILSQMREVLGHVQADKELKESKKRIEALLM